MRFKDLTVALALIRQVANDPTLDPVHRGSLLRARRQLQMLQRSGKVDRALVYRTVRLVSEALWNAAASDRDEDKR